MRQALCLLGLRPSRALWGLENFDLGVRRERECEEWYSESPVRDHNKVPAWWSTPLYAVPKMRHLWGEAQYELHPGAQELFLDLIFVGVAYRLGTVLKAAFYACTPPDELAAANYSSRQLSTVGGEAPGGGRQLYYDDRECIGLPLGVLHSLAPFMCMYMMWQVETNFRAKFEGCKRSCHIPTHITHARRRTRTRRPRYAR